MTFPQVEACIVCTEIKPETQGKFTITGLLGLSPAVFIEIDFPPGVADLSFLLLTGATDGGSHEIAFNLADERGEILLHSDAGATAVQPPQPRAYLIFQAFRVSYPKPGRYRCQLQVDKKVHYEGQFEL